MAGKRIGADEFKAVRVETFSQALFQKNLEVVYAIFFGIILSSIVLFFGGRLVMRSFAGIARIPGKLLMPGISLFCLFGSYAAGNNLYG